MSEELLALANVACPRCHAEAGVPCHDSAGNPLTDEEGNPVTEGGPVVHPARVVAYRESIGEPGWSVTAKARGTVTPGGGEVSHG